MAAKALLLSRAALCAVGKSALATKELTEWRLRAQAFCSSRGDGGYVPGEGEWDPADPLAAAAAAASSQSQSGPGSKHGGAPADDAGESESLFRQPQESFRARSPDMSRSRAAPFQELRASLREQQQQSEGGDDSKGFPRQNSDAPSERYGGLWSTRSSYQPGRAEPGKLGKFPSGGRAAQGASRFEENLFSVSSTANKAAGEDPLSGIESLFASGQSSASAESDFWESFPKKPKGEAVNQRGEGPSWNDSDDLDFILSSKGGGAGSPRSSWQDQSAAHDFSLRKVKDSSSHIDFLTDLQVGQTASKPAGEDAEESLFDFSASYSLLTESLKRVTPHRESVRQWQPNVPKGSSGLGPKDSGTSDDLSTILSQAPSLAELDKSSSRFFTVQDSLPAKEEPKTYTYEELGPKLQMVRPPKEKLLSGALGFSFRELRERIEKIEKWEEETPLEHKDDKFHELKESLEELRSSNAPRKLSYQELAFLNRTGTGVTASARVEYIAPKDDLLMKYYSPEQMSSKELLKLEITRVKKQFQMHESDSGSPQVQIAILTTKINNLNRHFRENHNYKRDKHSKKGLNDMVQYRKRLLWYLRRRDWDVYCNVLTKLRLDDIIHERRL